MGEDSKLKCSICEKGRFWTAELKVRRGKQMNVVHVCDTCLKSQKVISVWDWVMRNPEKLKNHQFDHVYGAFVRLGTL